LRLADYAGYFVLIRYWFWDRKLYLF